MAVRYTLCLGRAATKGANKGTSQRRRQFLKIKAGDMATTPATGKRLARWSARAAPMLRPITKVVEHASRNSVK